MQGRNIMKIKTELIFPRELKDEPIICEVCKKFEVTVNIVEASFSTETGWAILIVDAKEEELKKAFAYLKSREVEIKNIQEHE